MFKIIRGFRGKMLLLFGWSMLLSGFITYLIYKVLQYYYHTQVDYEDGVTRIRMIMNRVGDVNAFLIIFIPLAILFFFFLTKRYAAYFNRISEGIHHLANGDFDNRVQLASGDEFERIAVDINRASEKLKEALERGDFAESSKDQLVLNLAHDLRTPLTSVLGYLGFLLNEEQLTESQKQHYTTIAYTKSKRLEKLLDELFELTRMNYGYLTVDKRPIDLSELLSQLSEELFPLLEDKQLKIRLEIPAALQISADGDLLARVFENLLTNAVRYGSDGEYIDVKGFVTESEAVVQVKNYGDPISEADLPYVFDMLYTGDKARKQQAGSTGLGLFIAKNIVEKHHGTIKATSDWAGTSFEVRLPL